jgi:DNA-binding HxlR family transcriptional regulator
MWATITVKQKNAAHFTGIRTPHLAFGNAFSSCRAPGVQRTATSRANEDLLREDVRNLPQRLVASAQVSTVFVIDQGRGQANKFSTYEELAARFAIALVEGKWRVPILRQLQNGPLHFGELKRRLSPVSKKVLNQHLRLMAKDALITRSDLAGKMPRVEYSLANPLGYAVLNLLQAVAEWGDRHFREMKDEDVTLVSRD